MQRNIPPWRIERKLIIKNEEKTDPSYGYKPEERPLREHIRFGIINLDKPPGPSSHEVTAWVRKILGVNKAGHGGTLEAALEAGEIPK